jgi:PAS domain S-box-containing protein
MEILGSYFAIDVPQGAALDATYSPVLVTTSFVIATLAGLVFVNLSHRLSTYGEVNHRRVWVIVGGVVMGLGVWAMHFVGMIAYQIPVPVSYRPVETILSAVPAMVASAISLNIVSRRSISMTRLFVGGVLLGGGIGVMHYSGMAAMEIEGFVRYDPWLFTASIFVAVLLAVSALWVARWQQDDESSKSVVRTFGSAVLIGSAVAGMHYTAMSSTLCYPGGQSGIFGGLDPALLAGVTTIVAIMVLLAGIAAIIFDQRLTEEMDGRKTAVLHAEALDERLREAVETLPGSLALFDENDHLVLSNRQFADAYELSAMTENRTVTYRDVLRRHVAEKLTHDIRRWDSRGAVERITEAREKGKALSLETRNGTWSTIRQRRTSSGGTVFLRTDITKIRETQELLEQQSRRLRLIMDNVAEALITIDNEGRVESFNRAAESIFGYAESEMVGSHLSTLIADDVELQHSDGLRGFLASLSGLEPGEAKNFEFVGRAKNGSTVFLEAVFSAFKEGDRRLHIGAIRDITERHLTAVALNKARAEAERASMAKSEFISHMSHELRTPLNAVIGMSEALLMIDGIRTDDGQLRQYLSDILASGKHQLALVNDMLDLSTIETGGRSMRMEEFDAISVLSDLLRSMQTTAENHKSEILPVFGPGHDPVTVYADEQSFREVVLNIVSNGIIHAGPSSRITVNVESGAVANRVCVIVEDNGKGIPEDIFPMIGQPFPQVKNSWVRAAAEQDNAGTGLGLSIVKRLLDLNGGHFEVDSQPGRGTRVSIYWLDSKTQAENTSSGTGAA